MYKRQVEHLAELKSVFEKDVLSSGSPHRQLESKCKMLFGVLVVAIRVQDVILDLQVVIKVVEDTVHGEGGGHLVTLWRDCAVLFFRDKLWQTLAVGNEMTADILAIV